MRSINIISLAALAVGASASALVPRNAANNNCGRAVAGTAKGSAFMSSARADCSANVISYTTVTVNASAATLTRTVNVQVTALATSIETDVFSTTDIDLISSTEIDQYISTAYTTSIDVQTLTIPITSTPPAITATSTITITSSSASTVTSYYPTAAAVAKRDLEEDSVESDDCEIEGRDPATVPSSTSSAESTSMLSSTIATVSTPSSAAVLASTTSSIVTSVSSPAIPTYASACTNWAEYVAACSYAGVPQITSTVSTTLPANTGFVTVSSTWTTTLLSASSTEIDLSFTTFSTLLSTTTQSSTLTIPIISTSIETAYTTQTLSASTTTIYETETITVAGAIQTTSAPIPTFKLAMTPVGGGTTLYMTVLVGDALAYKSTTDITSASIFTIDTSNRLVTTASDPEIACVYNSLPNYYMEALRHTYLDAHPQYFTALKCTVNDGLTLTCVYGSANAFTYYPSQQSFFYSTEGYEGFTTYVANLIVQ